MAGGGTLAPYCCMNSKFNMLNIPRRAEVRRP